MGKRVEGVSGTEAVAAAAAAAALHRAAPSRAEPCSQRRSRERVGDSEGMAVVVGWPRAHAGGRLNEWREGVRYLAILAFLHRTLKDLACSCRHDGDRLVGAARVVSDDRCERCRLLRYDEVVRKLVLNRLYHGAEAPVAVRVPARESSGSALVHRIPVRLVHVTSLGSRPAPASHPARSLLRPFLLRPRSATAPAAAAPAAAAPPAAAAVAAATVAIAAVAIATATHAPTTLPKRVEGCLRTPHQPLREQLAPSLGLSRRRFDLPLEQPHDHLWSTVTCFEQVVTSAFPRVDKGGVDKHTSEPSVIQVVAAPTRAATRDASPQPAPSSTTVLPRKSKGLLAMYHDRNTLTGHTICPVRSKSVLLAWLAKTPRIATSPKLNSIASYSSFRNRRPSPPSSSSSSASSSEVMRQPLASYRGGDVSAAAAIAAREAISCARMEFYGQEVLQKPLEAVQAPHNF